jgi:hypothetical protein
MPQPTDLDLFIALSEVLTGEKKLDETLADQYLQRLKAVYPGPIQDVLKTFSDIAGDEHLVFEVKRRIVENAALAPFVQQIIRVWFTSEFNGPPPNNLPIGGTQAQYHSGLIWKVIQAHPPTLSKQPYGYWTTPPEDE